MKRSEKAFNDLLRDDNVQFIKTGDRFQPMHIHMCSYDIDLINHVTYVKKIFNKIITAKETIKKYFSIKKNNTFILSIEEFNIDGLDETNSKLITRNSIVECNY